MTPPLSAPPGLAAAVEAAARLGRVRFAAEHPALWWRECCAAVDATAEALADGEAEPAVLIARTSATLRTLMDLLGREVAAGQDVLSAICAASPLDRTILERIGREGLPPLADAAAKLHREVERAAARAPVPPGDTQLRRLVRHLAELYSEAFRDHNKEPARASHGDDVKGSPFRRMLEVLLRERAGAFADKHGFPSPIAPEHITPKVIRLALAERDAGGGWLEG